MIEEESDAAAFFAGREDEIDRPEDARWPVWSGYLYAAWNELRDDRHYGAMGGMGRIYYRAISTYADDNSIAGSDFDSFLILIRAIDDEYVKWSNEKAKAEMDKNKQT